MPDWKSMYSPFRPKILPVPLFFFRWVLDVLEPFSQVYIYHSSSINHRLLLNLLHIPPSILVLLPIDLQLIVQIRMNSIHEFLRTPGLVPKGYEFVTWWHAAMRCLFALVDEPVVLAVGAFDRLSYLADVV
jgi:hypothetical protein